MRTNDPGLQAIDVYHLVFNVFAAAVLLGSAPAQPLLALANIGLIVLIGVGVPWLARAPYSLARLLRGAYLMPACLLYYEQTYTLHRALHGDVVVDGWLARMDGALFGRQPSLALPALLPGPWIGELMSLVYLVFYPLVIVIGASALRPFSAERQRLLCAVMLTLTSCYLLFALLPSVGPRFYWPGLVRAIPGFAGAATLRAVLAIGERPTAAFPSSHVAVAMVTTCWSWRTSRRIFAVMAPLTAALAVATVYLQAHYAIDALAGAAYGLIMWWLSEPVRRMVERRLAPRWRIARAHTAP